MQVYVLPLECAAPFIVQEPCQEFLYQVYRIITGTPENPGTIIIYYEDYTFRVLGENDYIVDAP